MVKLKNRIGCVLATIDSTEAFDYKVTRCGAVLQASHKKRALRPERTSALQPAKLVTATAGGEMQSVKTAP